MFGLSGSQEVLVVFALVVGVIVYYKAQGVDIGSFDPITLGGPGSSPGANDSETYSSGSTP